MHHLYLKNKLPPPPEINEYISFGSPGTDPETRVWVWGFIWVVNLRNMSRNGGKGNRKEKNINQECVVNQVTTMGSGKLIQGKTHTSELTHQGPRGWGMHPVGLWLKCALGHESCTNRKSSVGCGKPQAQHRNSLHGMAGGAMWVGC